MPQHSSLGDRARLRFKKQTDKKLGINKVDFWFNNTGLFVFFLNLLRMFYFLFAIRESFWNSVFILQLGSFFFLFELKKVYFIFILSTILSKKKHLDQDKKRRL